jgi:Mitochondrial carrier protein
MSLRALYPVAALTGASALVAAQPKAEETVAARSAPVCVAAEVPARVVATAAGDAHDSVYYSKCMVGGILSCGLTHLAVTPLDVVKCRMQVRGGLRCGVGGVGVGAGVGGRGVGTDGAADAGGCAVSLWSEWGRGGWGGCGGEGGRRGRFDVEGVGSARVAWRRQFNRRCAPDRGRAVPAPRQPSPHPHPPLRHSKRGRVERARRWEARWTQFEPRRAHLAARALPPCRACGGQG